MARVDPRHFCMPAHYVNGLSSMKTHQIDDIVIAFNAERGVPVLARHSVLYSAYARPESAMLRNCLRHTAASFLREAAYSRMGRLAMDVPA